MLRLFYTYNLPASFQSAILWLSVSKKMNTISLKNQSSQERLVIIMYKFLKQHECMLYG